jgi:hypothetical protein
MLLLHRRLAALVAVCVLAGIAAGCSRENHPPASKAFCTAADDYNTELERAYRTGTKSVERQLPLVEQIARTAPKGIVDDAEAFLAAMRRRAAGDLSVVDDPLVKTAVDNVTRYANQACNVYKRDSGI